MFDGVFVQYPLSFANITNTFYTITGLAPGTALLLGVAAYDSYGNVSAYDYLPSLVVNPVPVPPILSLSPSSAATPLFAGNPPPASDGFQITVTAGNSGLQTFLFQATTNPADPGSWEQIGSLFPTANPFTFTDTNSAQYQARFYRIVAP